MYVAAVCALYRGLPSISLLMVLHVHRVIADCYAYDIKFTDFTCFATSTIVYLLFNFNFTPQAELAFKAFNIFCEL